MLQTQELPRKGRLLGFVHTIDAINRWGGRIIMYLVVVLALLLCTTAVARYVFHHPLGLAADITQFVAGGFFLLAGAYCLLIHAHVNMDIVRRRLPLRAGAILDSFTFIFFFAFIGVLVWQGGIITWKALVTQQRYISGAMPIIWPLRMTIPVGAALLLLQGIAEFIRSLHLAVTGRKLE